MPTVRVLASFGYLGSVIGSNQDIFAGKKLSDRRPLFFELIGRGLGLDTPPEEKWKPSDGDFEAIGYKTFATDAEMILFKLRYGEEFFIELVEE